MNTTSPASTENTETTTSTQAVRRHQPVMSGSARTRARARRIELPMWAWSAICGVVSLVLIGIAISMLSGGVGGVLVRVADPNNGCITSEYLVPRSYDGDVRAYIKDGGQPQFTGRTCVVTVPRDQR